MHRLKASFTIEAALVMSIVLLSIATSISFAYSKRDSVFKNYVLEDAATNAAHTEEVWLPKESTLESVKEYTDERLHIVGNLSSLSVTVTKDKLKGKASASVDEEIFETKIVNTEDYMRLTSVISDFLSEKEGD